MNWKDWFHFSTPQRTAIIILVIFILLVNGLRILWDDIAFVPLMKKVDTSLFHQIEMIEVSEEAVDSLRNHEQETNDLEPFDPNTATLEQFLRLGLNRGQARSIIKYRSSGGTFQKRKDFKKLYVIDENDYRRLAPYIKISGKTPQYDHALEKASQRNDIKKEQMQVALNQCDSSDLVKLKGIGPVFASRIIKYRELLGGYVDVNQLLEVYGMDSSRLEPLKDFITLDTANLKVLSLNHASFGDLIRHPYLNKHKVKAIMHYRKMQGHFNSTDELMKNNILTQDQYHQVIPYLNANKKSDLNKKR